MPSALGKAFELNGVLSASLPSGDDAIADMQSGNSGLNLADIPTVTKTEGRLATEISSKASVDYYFKFEYDINSKIRVQQDNAASDANAITTGDDDAYILDTFTTADFDMSATGAENNYRVPASENETGVVLADGAQKRVIASVQATHNGSDVANGLFNVELTVHSTEAAKLVASCALTGAASCQSTAIAENLQQAQIVYFNVSGQAATFGNILGSDDNATEQDKLSATLTRAEVLTHIGGQSALDDIADLYNGKFTIDNDSDIKATVDAVSADTNSAFSKFGRHVAKTSGRAKDKVFADDDLVVLSRPFTYSVTIPGDSVTGGAMNLVAETQVFAVLKQKA